MSNENKYCIQRKDLLESNQKVPVGATYMTIDKPTEYKWLTEDDFFVKVNGEWHSAESVDFDFIEPNASSESKHTPAPWNANKSEVYELSTGKTVTRTDIGGSDETTEANARLIAAAPTMYEALKAIRAIQKEEWDNPVLQKYGNIPALTIDIIAVIINEALKGIE